MRKFLNSVFGLFLIALISWGVIKLLKTSFDAFKALESQVAIATVACVVPLIATLLTLGISKLLERQAERRSRLMPKKIEVYESVMGFLWDILASSRTGLSVDSPEFHTRWLNDTKSLLTWGGDGVIKAYSDFKKAASIQAQEGSDSKKMLLAYEALLFAMRLDLGHGNKNLKETDLLNIFITDIAKAFPSSPP